MKLNKASAILESILTKEKNANVTLTEIAVLAINVEALEEMEQ